MMLSKSNHENEKNRKSAQIFEAVVELPSRVILL